MRTVMLFCLHSQKVECNVRPGNVVRCAKCSYAADQSIVRTVIA